jgi:hypothetical protein
VSYRLTGATDAHPGAAEAHIGAVKGQYGVVETNAGTLFYLARFEPLTFMLVKYLVFAF